MPLEAKVLSLKEILTRHDQLRVPDYQRTFRWEEDQIETLFADMLNGFDLHNAQSPKTSFLGSAVFAFDEKTEEQDLVDGQQRITTLSLFLSEASQRVLMHTSKDACALEAQKALKDASGSSTRILHKIDSQAKCSDRDAYQEIITYGQPRPNRYGPNTNTAVALKNAEWTRALKQNLIFKAWKTICSIIDNTTEATVKATGLSEEQVQIRILQRIMDSIRLVIIETDEKREGMRVFASLNASGMRLDPWELVMSTFYSHCATDIHRTRVKQLFEGEKNSLSSIYTTRQSGSKDSFLRSYWVGFHRIAAMEDVFDEYNDYLDKATKKNPNEIMEMLSRMLRALEIYRACDEPNDFKGINGATDYGFLYPLKLIGDKMSRSALMTANHLMLNMGQSERIDTLMRLSFAFERLRMRLHFCQMPANRFDRALSKLALAILNGELGDNPENIEKNTYKTLVALDGLPSQAKLRSDLKAYRFEDSSRMSQLILSKIQYARQYGPSAKATFYQHVPKMNKAGYQITKGIKLEAKDWSSAVQQRYGFRNQAQFLDLIDSIGNAYLINSGGQNIAISLAINQGSPISDLNADELLARRDILVDEAVDIWHFTTLG